MRRARAEPAADAGPSRRRAILSVEDVPTNQDLVAIFVSDEGHNLARAGSGQEAQEMLARAEFDLVLMDLRLPDADGLDIVRWLRAREGRARRTPVIALTADAMPTRAASARAAGVDAYLCKPFTATQLQQAIRDQLAPPATALAAAMAAPAPRREDANAARAAYGALVARVGPAMADKLRFSLGGQLERFLAMGAQPLDAIASAAHALGGAAALLGFEAAATDCLELERVCREGAPPAAAMKAAMRSCERIRRDIADPHSLAA